MICDSVFLCLSYSDYNDYAGDMYETMEETVRTPAASHTHHQSIVTKTLHSNPLVD